MRAALSVRYNLSAPDENEFVGRCGYRVQLVCLSDHNRLYEWCSGSSSILRDAEEN